MKFVNACLRRRLTIKVAVAALAHIPCPRLTLAILVARVKAILLGRDFHIPVMGTRAPKQPALRRMCLALAIIKRPFACGISLIAGSLGSHREEVAISLLGAAFSKLHRKTVVNGFTFRNALI